jgi:hypothetical protein
MNSNKELSTNQLTVDLLKPSISTGFTHGLAESFKKIRVFYLPNNRLKLKGSRAFEEE